MQHAPGPAARMMASWRQLDMLNGSIPDDPAEIDIIYIAGPMTNYPEHNYPAFNTKAAELRTAGHTVINPAEVHGQDFTQDWDWYLRRDLTQLVKCNRVVLLPGWEQSRGARLEVHVARALGLEIVYPTEGDTA